MLRDMKTGIRNINIYLTEVTEINNLIYLTASWEGRKKYKNY
jgi:hypothetical protein